MKIFNFILILTLSTSVLAQDIVPIKKNDSSPLDGFVIDSAMEKKMRKINEENKLLKESNVTLKELGTLQDIKLDIHKENLKMLEDENASLRTKNTISGVMYFILGSVVTGAIAYGLIKTLPR